MQCMAAHQNIKHFYCSFTRAAYKTVFMRYLLMSFCVFLIAWPAKASIFNDFDDTNATIFAYNRIGDTQNGGIRIDQFKSHITEITNSDYNVVALPALIHALKNNTPLPPRTIALTFDTGHISIVREAIPLLEEHDLPYTLFITTENAEKQNPQYLKWNDLRNIAKSDLATIGIHGARYHHIAQNENAPRDINGAIAKFRTELGFRPLYFSYPYGEYTDNLRETIENAGFHATLGQSSSITYNGSDHFALPRFLMTEKFGDRARFQMAANALPLPVTDIAPDTSITSQNPPRLGFTLHPAMIDKKRNISCFGSGQGKADLEFLGDDRIEVRFTEPFYDHRVRVNCTLKTDKTHNDQPIWRWFGMLYHLQ